MIGLVEVVGAEGKGEGEERTIHTYSILVDLHFKELKLSEAYTETVMSESLFLL